jgi:hypothetical protein
VRPDDSRTYTPVHRAPRRPSLTWPAALLPGALLLTLISVGTVGSTSLETPRDVPVTDLHVVVGDSDAG